MTKSFNVNTLKTMLCKGSISMLAILCSLTIASAQSKWDSEHAVYTDHNYHFHWSLPSEYGWIKDTSIDPNSIFHATVPDEMEVDVTVMKYGSYTSTADIWNEYATIKKSDDQAVAMSKEMMGGSVKYTRYEKCTFVGTHAIASTAIITLDSFSPTLVFYTYTYKIFKGSYMWYITFKCISDFNDKYGETGVKKIFDGFGFGSE